MWRNLDFAKVPTFGETCCLRLHWSFLKMGSASSSEALINAYRTAVRTLSLIYLLWFSRLLIRYYEIGHGSHRLNSYLPTHSLLFFIFACYLMIHKLYGRNIITKLPTNELREAWGSYNPESRGFDSGCQWIFNWPDPSSRTMDLESTQPLTEMGTRNHPVGKGRPECKANNITAICEPNV
jgi:hypothetical protein